MSEVNSEAGFTSGRLIPLEGYRGIAAFIVLVHHFFLGFSPYTTGLLREARNEQSLVGHFYFVLFNGTAAVSFFFVLSGFVLCWSFFKHEDPDRLLLSFLRRWPRLVGPVVLTTVSSWLLFKLGGYFFAPAAIYSQSPWLANFAFAGWTPNFHPSLAAALSQGILTFFSGQITYNTNLWTMRPELLGSFIVFALAIFIVSVLRYRFLVFSAVVLAAALIGSSMYLFSFTIGVFFSAYFSRRARPSSSVYSSACLLLIGLYLLGYVDSIGVYSWVRPLRSAGVDCTQTVWHTIGAMLIIYSTMSCETLFRGMNNKVCVWLGRISFPLYLVHTLVICSSSSFLFLTLHDMGWGANQILCVTFMATLFVSVGLAVPLMVFDEWWMKRVDQVIKRLFKGRVPTT